MTKPTYFNSTKSCYKVEGEGYTAYYSYNTPVLLYLKKTNEAFTTVKKFSVTTSRHLSIMKADLKYMTVTSLTNDEFKKLLTDKTSIINLGQM